MIAAAENTTANAPRVVHQIGALFFVSPENEIWRVHDTDYTGTARLAPSANLGVRARVFVAATGTLTLTHHFTARDSRSLDPRDLLEQLDRTC
jgi:hypothetical protein